MEIAWFYKKCFFRFGSVVSRRHSTTSIIITVTLMYQSRIFLSFLIDIQGFSDHSNNGDNPKMKELVYMFETKQALQVKDKF